MHFIKKLLTVFLLASTALAQNITIQKSPSDNTLTSSSKTIVVPNGGSITTAGNGTINATNSLLISANLSDVSSTATSRSNLQLAYPDSAVAASGNIALWGNSMGITGALLPWPFWLQVRSGRPVYNGSVPGETSTQIKARFDAHPEMWGYFTIFDVSRNDTDFEVTKANLDAMIASLGHTRYIVIGVLCRQSTPIGNAQHTLDLAFDSYLSGTYGERFYNPQGYIVGLWNPASAQDVIDHNNDVIPSSLTNDGTHYNPAGHTATADRITPLVLHSIASTSSDFQRDVTVTKSAPTISLTNTGAGAGSYAIATTAAAGQFRVTEIGVADRLAISKGTGFIGAGTTNPLARFVASNEGANGLEIDPANAGGTQTGLLSYNRASGIYTPIALTAAGFNFSVGNISLSKSAPTLTLTNTDTGGAAFALSTTAAAGQFRVTEVGIADRLSIAKTTGFIGAGTTNPLARFVVSNEGANGLEIDPASAGGAQTGLLSYNRASGAYTPVAFAASAFNFSAGDFTLTKSAPTLTLTNTGGGGGGFSLATTAAAGQFRITETGVADRFVIDMTTGNTGVGTTNPIGLFSISNGGAAGLEFDPRVASGTQINMLAYNRAAGAYVPLVLAAESLTVIGYLKPPQAASAPAYVKGAVYFDTTLNKLRVGGASTWETITSAP